jgi:hypothetical protein
MHFRAILLPLLLVVSLSRAAEPSSTAPAVEEASLRPEPSTSTSPRLSARLTEEIRATLPAFDPQLAAAAPRSSAVGTPGTDLPPTPDILQLPTFTIRERVEQRLDPDQMISGEDLLDKQKRAYLNELEREGGELTRILNSFHIPLVTPSVAARARAHYQNQKTVQLAQTVAAIAKLDPKAAVDLRKELAQTPDRPSLGRK